MGKIPGIANRKAPTAAGKAPTSKNLELRNEMELDLFSAIDPDFEPVDLTDLEEAEAAPKIYSVSEISESLRDSLRENFSDILIQGEVADFKGTHRSGHLYFALKDDSAAIKAVMWKGSLAKVPFEIKQGLEVICTGKLDYYGGSGSLQLVIEKMEPVGVGALQLKLEQLKEKLKSEGLFDSARKRKISPINWRIGIVTSKTTAALQDMLKIYRTRFPLAEIFLFSASVQGEKAAPELIRAIESANRYSAQAPKSLDVLVVTRGGGSYEDLFCFNDENLARAIVASKIPVISAVGHEIDFTISDFVADKRSATPSHAASESVPEMKLWQERLDELKRVWRLKMNDLINDRRQKVDQAYNRMLAASPERRLKHSREILEARKSKFTNAMKWSLEKRKTQIARIAGILDALSPLKVLDRGYSIATFEDGKVFKSIQSAQVGTELKLKVSDGDLKVKII